MVRFMNKVEDFKDDFFYIADKLILVLHNFFSKTKQYFTLG
jgi:hypothetical protein